MKRIILVILCFGVLVVAGCSKDSPVEVAGGFWTAMADRDLETARSLVTKETANSIMLNDNTGNGDFTVKFGDVTEEVSYSAVETIMLTSGGEVSLRTIVVKEKGKWKVDAARTMMSMFGGAMGEMMQQLGEAMKDGMDEFGKGMQESMEQLQREMERKMEEDRNTTGPVVFQN